jgi:PAS domain S-box-containing protein
VAAAPIGFAFVDRDARFVRANEAFAALDGLPAADHPGRAWADVLPDLGAAAADALARVLETGEAAVDVDVDGETAAQPGHRRAFVLSFYPVAGDAGTVDGAGVIARETTELREALAALHETTTRFSALVDSNMIGVIVGEGEDIVDANDAFLQMLGYSRADLDAGRLNWPAMTPPEWAAADRKAYGELLEVGVQTPYEKEYLRKDGARVPVIIGAAMIDASARRWICFVLDLSDRRAAERDREAALEREQQARAQAEELTRHLRALQGMTEAVLSGPSSDELVHDLLDRVIALFDADAAAILLLEPGEDVLRGWVSHGLSSDAAPDLVRVPVASGVAGRIAAEGRPVVFEDLSKVDVVNPALRRMRSLAGTPLIAEGRLIGVLHVDTVRPRQFRDIDIGLLQLAADRIALAIEHVGLYERERLARVRVEQAADRVSRLQSMTAVLAGAVTRQEVADAIVREGASAVDAAGAVVALADPRGRVEIAASVGYPPELIERFADMSLDDPLPLVQAIAAGEPVFVTSQEQRDRDFPALADMEFRASASIPLAAEGTAFGAFGISFAGPRVLSAGDRAFLVALAHQCALALERARLYEDERSARREAETLGERMAFLASASDVLSQSLDLHVTLQEVGRLVVPALADWYTIHLERDGRTEIAAVEHPDSDRAREALEMNRRYPTDPKQPYGVPNVLRTGRPELYPEIPQALLERAARDDEHRAMIRSLGMRSALIVPLRARDRTFGAMSMVATDASGIRYGPESVALAEELAHRIGMSIDNALLYEEQRRAAVHLQRTLLPPSLPAVPGVQIAATYRPLAQGAQVGGDFYDAFQATDGAWAFVIGDVCGKGIEAAALTGLARHTVRAVAKREARPSTVLRLLNEALLDDGTDEFCTVAMARLCPDEGSLTVCCGGHPLPLVLRAGGGVEVAGRPGTLLGVFADPMLVDHELTLGPGDAVLLFTDGVIEVRDGTRIMGESGLRDVLAGCVGLSAAAIVERVETAVAEFAPVGRDDMAIMAVRIEPHGA